MPMRKIFAITAAAALCLCSCSDSKYVFIDSFPISGELQPVRTMKYDPVKVNLYGIARAGDLITEQLLPMTAST